MDQIKSAVHPSIEKMPHKGKRGKKPILKQVLHLYNTTIGPNLPSPAELLYTWLNNSLYSNTNQQIHMQKIQETLVEHWTKQKDAHNRHSQA